MLRSILAASLATVSAADTDGLGFNLHFHAPEGSGEYPLILFVSGFSGLAPAFTYGKFVSALSEKGYIVVGMDHVKLPNYPAQGQAFHDVMEWVAAGNLTAELKAANIDATADLSQVAVMGQSAGNHVVGQGLTDGCSIAKAQVLIDPVDGFDPFGMVHSEDLITPGEKLTYSIPSLLLDNELDPKKKNFLFPACAPAKLGANRWFDAAAGPIFNVNASRYGHIDCLDNAYIAAGNLICPTDKTTDKDAYRNHLASTIDLFLDGVFNGKSSNFDQLEDATSFGVDVTVRQDLKSMSHSDIKPVCTNNQVTV